MKFIPYLSLLSVLALACVQCSDDYVTQMQFNGPISRSIAPVDSSETNPTLLTDWENCKTVKLNEVAANGKNREITLPWQNGSSTRLNSHFCEDIKAADGWYMLFHTFCKSNTDDDLSYLCLYNKFTGYMKVFYYTDLQDNGNETIWHLSSNDESTPQPLFADLEYFSQPIDGDKTYTVWSATADNMIVGQKSEFSKGWNGFEFRIGEYHPTISTNLLQINATNRLCTDINIDGVTESTTIGTLTTVNTSSSSFDNIVNALASISGPEAKKLVDSFASTHLNKKFLGIDFPEIISRINADDYVSALKSGLGAIFNVIASKKESTKQWDVKLKTNGKLNLKGTALTELTSGVKPLRFDLEEVLSYNRQISENSYNQNLASILSSSKTELGVWNLKERPTVYYERYTKFENVLELTDKDYVSSALDLNGFTLCPNTQVKANEIEVVFNPAIKDYVKSYSVDVSLIDVEGGNRNLYNKKKTVITYDRFNNMIKNDTSRGIRVFGINSMELNLWGLLYDIPGGSIEPFTQFYVDWGEEVGGNRAAVVTLTMNIDYNGKQMSFTESRVYDVVYKPYSPKTTNPHNPPYTYTINKKGTSFSGFELPKGY